MRKKRPFPSTPIPRRRRGTHLNNNVTIIKIQKVYQEKIFKILEKKMKVLQGAAGREGSRARGFLVSGPEPAAGAWVPWAGFDSGLSEAAATSSSAGHGRRNNNFSKKFLQKFTENFRKKIVKKILFFCERKDLFHPLLFLVVVVVHN